MSLDQLPTLDPSALSKQVQNDLRRLRAIDPDFDAADHTIFLSEWAHELLCCWLGITAARRADPLWNLRFFGIQTYPETTMPAGEHYTIARTREDPTTK